MKNYYVRTGALRSWNELNHFHCDLLRSFLSIVRAVRSRIAVRHRERQRRQVHRDRTTASSFSPPYPSPDHHLSLATAEQLGSLASSDGLHRFLVLLLCRAAGTRVSVRVSRLGEIPPGRGTTKDRWRRDWEQGRRERSSGQRFNSERGIAGIRHKYFSFDYEGRFTIPLWNYLSILPKFLKNYCIHYKSRNSEMTK